jgi:uncharacterized membrane protein/protein-disulfide isomerase
LEKEVLPTAENNMAKYSDTPDSNTAPVLIPSKKDEKQGQCGVFEEGRGLASPQENAAREDESAANPRQQERVWFQNQLSSAQGRRIWLSLLIGIPAMIALGYSVFLFGIWLTKSSIAGCSGSVFDCDSVLGSKWSAWLGIPVSGLAMMNYLVMASALWLAQTGDVLRRELMWKVIIFCGLSAFCAALWFIFVQKFLLNHWCKYCLIAHCCGLFIGTVLLLARPLGSRVNLRMGTLALAGLAVLAVGQTFSQEPDKFQFETYDQPTESDLDGSQPGAEEEAGDFIFDAPDIFEAPGFGFLLQPRLFRYQQLAGSLLVSRLSLGTPLAGTLTYPNREQEEQQDQQSQKSEEDQKTDKKESAATPAKERRLAEMRGGKAKLVINQWPHCGNDNAEYAVIEMFDYNCRHCRSTHQAVKAAKEQMGEKLAVIALPVPLNNRCNKQVNQTLPQFLESCDLAKLAIAVWRTNPEKFGEFHNYMFTGPTAPNYASAKKQAESLVDATQLNEILATDLPQAYIEKHVQLYQAAGGGTIPKLLFKSTAIVGEYNSTSGLIDVIRNHGQITVSSEN